MDRFDALVVGAGVVGLAVARALAQGGLGTLVLEAEGSIGSGISSRNSEVIHAGIYYAPGSLKARLCVAGRDLLYAYCAERGIAHRRCGKLIVATDAREAAALDAIEVRARACGVHDLQRLTGAEARRLEPALACHAALLSPSTGIVDSHALMTSLLGAAENAGAVLALRTPYAGAERAGDGWRVRTGDGFEFDAGCIVNAAGLAAHAVAAATAGVPPLPPRVLAKGNYFALAGRSPFSRLIYPVPVDGGLGTHLTLDLSGQARFGPDVEWIASVDYTVDPARAPAFEAGIRRWWPALPAGGLQPAYSGIRPKLSGPGAPAADFVLLQADKAVHLLGIESPGLTASLALAEAVHRIVRDMTHLEQR